MNETRPIEYFCEHITSGGTPSSTVTEYYGGAIPWLRTQEVVFNRIYSTELTISDAGLSNSNAKWIPANSVIVAMYGNSAGRVATNAIPLTTNQACCNLIIDSKKADYRYVYYALLQNYGALKGLSRGAAQNNLNGSQVREFEIPYIDLKLQSKTAELLSNYDDLIENNRRRITLLEEAARQLYQEWFVRLRFPDHKNTKIVDGVPEGWEQTTLENALVLQRGFDLPSQDREDGDIPIYGSTGIVGFHNKAMASGPGLVTGRSGTLGKVHFVTRDFFPLNTSLWVREFRKVSPFFGFFLLSALGLEKFNGGASVPTLDRKAVHRLDIIVPPQKISGAFDRIIAPMFSMITNLTLQNEKLRDCRDLLLPRLISGEITV